MSELHTGLKSQWSQCEHLASPILPTAENNTDEAGRTESSKLRHKPKDDRRMLLPITGL